MIERRIRALVAKPGLDTDEAATLRSATSSHLGPRSHPGGTRLG
jgi:hypothetical protein